NFPEKTAKPLTPLRPCRRGEVGQKGTRLSRGRKLDPVTSAPNLHLSQKAQRETSACHCHGWSLFRWLYPNPDISHWRGVRGFERSAVSCRLRGRRDSCGFWRLVRMAMFPALWKVRRKAAAYAAALVNRAWARAHSAC